MRRGDGWCSQQEQQSRNAVCEYGRSWRIMASLRLGSAFYFVVSLFMYSILHSRFSFLTCSFLYSFFVCLGKTKAGRNISLS